MAREMSSARGVREHVAAEILREHRGHPRLLAGSQMVRCVDATIPGARVLTESGETRELKGVRVVLTVSAAVDDLPSECQMFGETGVTM